MTVGWFTALIFTETSQQVQDGWTDGSGQSSEWIPEMNTDFGVPLILFCSTIMKIICVNFVHQQRHRQVKILFLLWFMLYLQNYNNIAIVVSCV